MAIPLGLKKEYISPMTEAQAKEKEIYYEVTSSTTKSDILDFFDKHNRPHNRSYVYVKTRSGKEVILEVFKISPYFEGSSYEASTGKLKHEFLDEKQLLQICLNPATKKMEINDGKTTIFLDEYNLRFYMDDAKKVLRTYGKDKVPDMSITGEQYYQKVKEMYDIAYQIMNKQLLPNIFDLIPLKKDRTFQANRRIYIYENGVTCYEHGYKIALCIVPDETVEFRDEYDMSEDANEYRARLAISFIMGVKKANILLDRDLKIQDIKKKVRYLKQEDLNVGAIYKEKNGPEFLFLGRIAISYEFTRNGTLYLHPLEYTDCKPIKYYYYIKVTKKIREIIDKSKNLDEFLELLANEKLKVSFDDFGFSVRRDTVAAPRKFVEETSFPFEGKGWVNVNKFGVHATPGLPCKVMFTMDIMDGRTSTMKTNHFVIGYDESK